MQAGCKPQAAAYTCETSWCAMHGYRLAQTLLAGVPVTCLDESKRDHRVTLELDFYQVAVMGMQKDIPLVLSRQQRQHH